MSRRLFQSGEELISGAFPDFPTARISLWEQANNIVFDPEGPRPIHGFLRAVTKQSTAPVRGMIQAFIDGERYIFWGDSIHLWRGQEDGTAVDVSRPLGYNGNEETHWSFAQWGHWMLASNGVDPIQLNKNDGSGFVDLAPQDNLKGNYSVTTANATNDYFEISGDKTYYFPEGVNFSVSSSTGNDGSYTVDYSEYRSGSDETRIYVQGDVTDGTDDGTITVTDLVRSGLIASYKAYAVAFGVDPAGRQIRWSDADDAENWSVKLGTDAGDLYVRDIDSPIKAIRPHEKGIFFFGLNSLHLLSYMGSPYVMGQKKLMEGIGALGPRAVTQVEGTLFGFGPSGLWSSNGNSYEYIDAPVHNYVYDDLPETKRHLVCTWYDSNQQLVVFSYPSKTLNVRVKSVAYNLRTKTWSLMNFGATAGAYGRAFQYSVAGTAIGGVFFMGHPEGGTNISQGSMFLPAIDKQIIYNNYGKFGYGQLGYGKTEVDWNAQYE